IDALMQPTRIYVKSLLSLLSAVPVHAFAHITGGGITENLPRVLPQNTGTVIDLATWSRPPVFDWLKEQGRVADSEMLKTFNCGIGMIVCVAAEDEARAIAALQDAGETVWTLGDVVANEGAPAVTYLNEW
ncbi:MAG: phosphoribosylformylglycinamidine cyclo-ligase, partial [Methylococcus sp.]